jgi:D-amino-acid dehydrogenase
MPRTSGAQRVHLFETDPREKSFMKKHMVVIGGGITGVTSAYALVQQGFDVTLIEKNRYPGMETSYANGGQLSASNAEVWTHPSTIIKGLKWMFKNDAPLLMNPTPTWHKFSWMAEFMAAMPKYRENTIATAQLAIESREHHFAWAKAEGIEFDHKREGILHFYRDKKGFDHAGQVSKLLAQGGLSRRAVTPEEIKAIEPTLHGDYYGGYFTESDSTGDIHKFTYGLAKACERLGVKILNEHEVLSVAANGQSAFVQVRHAGDTDSLTFDGIVICAGVHGRGLAAQLGDRLNIYPVKGYSITVGLNDEASQAAAPQVSLLDDETKLVTSRLGADRFRVAGTAEFNGIDLNIRADRIKPLVNWVNECFPGVDTRRVEPWAGLRPMMPNMLPRVGAGKKANVFYNTGHGHLGWTLSAITAHQLAGHVMAAMQDNVRSFLTPATA